MDIQQLFQETVSLLREAIMSQAEKTGEIEKQVARILSDIEYLKSNLNNIYDKTIKNSEKITAMESRFDIVNRAQDDWINELKESAKQNKTDITQISIIIAKKIGEIGAITALIYILIRHVLSK